MSQKLNILIAYPYMKPAIIERLRQVGPDIRLLVDSGAFTAWKAGKTIALDDYCRFLEKLPITPWRYFTLDVVGDPHASMVNYETMLRRGFKPVPIFTRGEDPSVLDDYYKTSDVVGIGGLVHTKGNHGFVKGIMRLAAGRHVHLLGFTNMDMLKAFRPYTVDSSTWKAGVMHAKIHFYYGHGKVRTIYKSDFINKPSDELMDAVKYLGIDPYLLRKKSSWSANIEAPMLLLCVRSFIRMSLDIEKHIGTKVFMATGPSLTDFDCMLESFNYLRGRSNQ